MNRIDKVKKLEFIGGDIVEELDETNINSESSERMVEKVEGKIVSDEELIDDDASRSVGKRSKPRLREDDERYIVGTRAGADFDDPNDDDVKNSEIGIEEKPVHPQNTKSDEMEKESGAGSAEKDAHEKEPLKKSNHQFVGENSETVENDSETEDAEPAIRSGSTYISRGVSSVVRSPSENGVSNVLVEYDCELPTVVEEVEKVKTQKVIVSIPEGSDLLVSSVGMRLIARHADKQGKLVVIVTDDPAGRNMARLAGLGVADSTSAVDEQLWTDVQSSKAAREQVKTETKMPSEPAVEELPQKDSGVLVNKDFHDNIEETNGSRRNIDGLEVGEVPKVPQERVNQEDKDVFAVGMKSNLSTTNGVDEETMATEERADAIPNVRKVSVGDFEMVIDEGGKNMEFSNPRSLSGSMGSERGDNKSVGLVGRDFSGIGKSNGDEMKSYDTLPVRTSTQSFEPKLISIRTVGAKIAGVFAKISHSGVKVAGVLGKSVFRKLFVPLLLVLGIVFFVGYWYVPEVVVELNVESIAVDYTGDITALSKVETTDKEKLTISARLETVEKTGSDTADATGTAVRGEKAGGIVIFYNNTYAVVTVAAGTVISNGSFNFVVQSDVAVPACDSSIPPVCDNWRSAPGDVVAESLGGEYNLVIGTKFSIPGHEASNFYGQNNVAFTGGSSASYQVVSQSDIDDVAERLKTQLYEEAKQVLAEKLKSTKWVFVEASIKNEIDGDVSSDVPAGAESAKVNVNVKTKSTAIYYDGKALKTLISDLLVEDLSEEELKNVEISDDLTEKVTVESTSVDDGNVVIAVEVSGFVMPQLDKDLVERDLYGKPWAEGIAYLKKLDYVSGDPAVDFYPKWFPGFLRRMPSRKGQITVNVKNVVPGEGNDGETSGAGVGE